MHTLTECKCLSAVKPSIAFTHEAGKPHAAYVSLCYTIRENIYEMKHSWGSERYSQRRSALLLLYVAWNHHFFRSNDHDIPENCALHQQL
jgi:hypothetical protein